METENIVEDVDFNLRPKFEVKYNVNGVCVDAKIIATTMASENDVELYLKSKIPNVEIVSVHQVAEWDLSEDSLVINTDSIFDEWFPPRDKYEVTYKDSGRLITDKVLAPKGLSEKDIELKFTSSKAGCIEVIKVEKVEFWSFYWISKNQSNNPTPEKE